jgi:hypothetical protein
MTSGLHGGAYARYGLWFQEKTVPNTKNFLQWRHLAVSVNRSQENERWKMPLGGGERLISEGFCRTAPFSSGDIPGGHVHHAESHSSAGRASSPVSASRPVLLIVFPVQHRSVRTLPVERLAILDAAAQKSRPGRHGNLGVDRFGKQRPQLRVMPAKAVSGAVAMRANARPEPPHLLDKPFARHMLQIVVHCSRTGHRRESSQPGLGLASAARRPGGYYALFLLQQAPAEFDARHIFDIAPLHFTELPLN